MIQQIKALLVLAEDSYSTPSTHMASIISVSPVPGNMLPSSGLHKQCTHVPTYTQHFQTFSVLKQPLSDENTAECELRLRSSHFV